LRFLDERVKNVKDIVAAPGIGILSQEVDLFFVVILKCDPLSVTAEGIELVYELIDDIPCPVILLRISNIRFP